uniref:SOWAHA-C winged helix-turn-helix domain-containing protein n=1 Tax=Gadus morhua TaxID=8049 RepID=A0A8C5BZ03_GADMO
MGDVTEESLLDYFYSTGGDSGKVKNADLLKTYKPYIGHTDLQLRAKYREEFKLIMDRIAVMKSENGENILVLRRKYRQMLVERDGPSRTPATARWEAPAQEAYSPVPAKRPLQEISAEQRPLEGEDRGSGRGPSSWGPEPGGPSECADLPSSLEYDSEQDAESLGPTSIALDPIEKDWIYSAASARVPDLSQLLQQDPSLANKKGYTPLHIAALHGHQHMVELLVQTYGAKKNLRDYSGHLASQYLTDRDPDEPGEESETQLQAAQARERGRNRKLPSLFLSKKKWGSAEELAPIEEERSTPPQPLLPAYRPRKFSR